MNRLNLVLITFISFNVDNEGVQITYTYKSKKDLFIQLFYEGGITDIEIHEEDSRTVSKYTNEYD